MSILDKSNIDILRTILREHPLLKINKNDFNNILMSEVKRLHADRFKYRSNLTEMNKQVIKTFQKIAIDLSQQVPQAPQIQPQSINDKYINQRQIEQNRQKMNNFEKRLKDKQNDFESLIKAKQPKEIDFSDKFQDKPIQSSQIDITMSQREAELAAIMKNQNKNKNVENWLQGKSNDKPANIQNLKIDHSSNVAVNVEPIPIKKEKRRVHFEVKEKDNDLTFFKKLKRKTEEDPTSNIFNKEIRDILEGIARNQMVLIEEMKNLNKNIQQNMERNKKINTVENKVTGIVQKYDAI